MKKTYAVICLLALCATTLQAAYDGQITSWSRQVGYYSGSGGEFTLNVDAALQARLITANGSFQSFCLETAENFSGNTYNVNLNNRAVLGGTTTGDPISIGTAWLYSEFRAGTLSGYDYNAAQNRATSAGALQAAIWWLEGEGGSLNSFVATAMTTLGLTQAQIVQDAGANNYNVVVLNLYTPAGGRAQDQLGLVPEPTTVIAGMGALALLVAGAGVHKRRSVFHIGK